MIITIDGTQAVGKTQTAKELAKLLNGTYVNSGAIYKMWALKGKEKALTYPHYDQYEQLNTPENLQRTIQIAENKDVRDQINVFLRNFVKNVGVFIFEGRDMAYVFPNADFKFYVDAKDEVKAKRYMKVVPECTKYEDALRQVKELDERDKNRAIAPLRRHPQAIFYDNTDSPDAKTDAIVLWYYLTHWKEISNNLPQLRILTP